MLLALMKRGKYGKQHYQPYCSCHILNTADTFVVVDSLGLELAEHQPEFVGWRVPFSLGSEE